METTSHFMVLEDNHHDEMSLHKFRDMKQFFDYMVANFGDDEHDPFIPENWDGMYTDPNGDTWSEYSGLYTHDHTKD